MLTIDIEKAQAAKQRLEQEQADRKERWKKAREAKERFEAERSERWRF